MNETKNHFSRNPLIHKIKLSENSSSQLDSFFISPLKKFQIFSFPDALITLQVNSSDFDYYSNEHKH